MTLLKDITPVIEPHTVIYIYDNEPNMPTLLAYFTTRNEKSIHEQVCESKFADYEIVNIKAKTHCLHITIDWFGGKIKRR